MPIPLRLTVHRGEQLIAEHRFERDIVKIGRLASAHLKLEDTRVSRIHAVIEAGSDGQDYAIIDMGSTEGTFVNGRKVSKEKLSDGDEITLGDYRVRVGYGDTRDVSGLPRSTGATPMSSGDVIAATPDPASGVYSNPSGVPLGQAYPPLGYAATAPTSGLYPMPGGPEGSGVYPAPGGTGNYAIPPGSGVYPAASGVYPAPPGSHPNQTGPVGYPTTGTHPVTGGPGSYPMGGAWGGYPQPPHSVTGPIGAEGSGIYPAPDGSGVYRMPPGVSGSTADVPTYSGLHPGQLPSPEAGAPAGRGDVAMGPAGSTLPAPADGSTTGPLPGGYHPGWAPPPTVPNNLAGAGVSEDERSLEIKLIWGNSVLETVTATDAPKITMGDERRVKGFGPLQSVVRCDIETPSRGLPSKTHVLARRQGNEGTSYTIQIPPNLTGRVERADGTVIPVELLYQGEHGADRDGEGGASYPLRAAETMYLGYGDLVLQIRYVRRTQLVPIPFLSRINYVWANTLILAFFFHIVAISSFVATPERSAQLTDELFKNQNRFIETRLKLAERKNSGGGLLDDLKKGPGEKAAQKEGKAGRRDAKKTSGRMASKGDPNDKEQARRALDKLLGLGGKGRAAGIFGGSGLGGSLKAAMGGLTGRQVGDARGLGGLGTRGAGPGGGGLSMNSVGLGALGTAGRGGGGEGGAGYGSGAASLGGKKERDVEITAGQAIVRGSLSKEIIRRVIRKHQAQIRYCYEKELQRAPGLYGKVSTEFIIAATGLVTDAKVKQSTMNNGEVERCITAKIRTWRFPKPKGGGIVVVTYPFLFKASG